MTAGLVAGDAVVIAWGVKRSLLDYMARSESFSHSAGDGAAFDPEVGALLPAVVADDGAIVATGSLLITAHEGALIVPLGSVRIEDGLLTVDDPIEPGARFPLLRLTAVESEDGLRWTTALTHEADALFLHNYLPGTAFDDVIVRRA